MRFSVLTFSPPNISYKSKPTIDPTAIIAQPYFIIFPTREFHEKWDFLIWDSISSAYFSDNLSKITKQPRSIFTKKIVLRKNLVRKRVVHFRSGNSTYYKSKNNVIIFITELFCTTRGRRFNNDKCLFSNLRLFHKSTVLTLRRN